MPQKVLIITGPAGDAQGWGDLAVTECIAQAIKESGKSAEIAFVKTMEDFLRAIDTRSFDIVWSALYHISPKSDTIGMSNGEWLADILDKRSIPYIGPGADTMKALIHKTATHRILHKNGISVPWHIEIHEGEPLPEITFPAFIKPSFESRSVGIDDGSVVDNIKTFQDRISYIHKTFEQPALAESYLPGQEYTVLMLGNGNYVEFIPGRVDVDPSLYGKYPILRSDLRGVGVTKINPAGDQADKAVELCRQAMDALDCRDHVRTDMRLDASGKLTIIEVNGIPGLKPVKSWSPQLYSLNHPEDKDPDASYRNLIDTIVTAALKRGNSQ